MAVEALSWAFFITWSCITIFLFTRGLLRKASSRAVRGTATTSEDPAYRARFCRCCQRRGNVTEKEEDVHLAKYVQSEVNSRRDEFFLQALPNLDLMGAIAGVSAASAAFRTLTATQGIVENDETWESDGQVQHQGLLEDILLLIHFATIGLLTSVPSLRRLLGKNIIHCLQLFSLLAWGLPSSDFRLVIFERWKLGFAGYRMFLSCTPLKVSLTLKTNTLYSLCMLCCVFQVAPSDRPQYCLTELAVFTAIVFFVGYLEKNMVVSVGRDVKEQFLLTQHSAAEALLRMFCEGSLELDEELRFVRESPFFSNALFHGPGKQLKGQLITSYVSDNFVNSFHKALTIPTNDEDGGNRLTPTKPKMFQTSFRDAWGNGVIMEIYHVAFYDVTGRLHHLLGMKEFDSDASTTAGTNNNSSEDRSSSNSNSAECNGLGSSSRGHYNPDALGRGSGAASAKRNKDRLPAHLSARPKAGGVRGQEVGLSDVVETASPRQPPGTRPFQDTSEASRSPTSNLDGDGSTARREHRFQAELLAEPGLKIITATPKFKRKVGNAESLLELLEEPEVFQTWLLNLAKSVLSGATDPGPQVFGLLRFRCGSQTHSRAVMVIFGGKDSTVTFRASGRRSHSESSRNSSRSSGSSRTPSPLPKYHGTVTPPLFPCAA